jgi:autotransporter family porin
VNGFIEHDKSSINTKWNFKGNLVSFALVILGLVIIFSYGVGNVAAAGNTTGDNVYVDTHGNDSWDGLSSTHSGLTGPKLTIQNATGTVNSGGTVNIAKGYYTGAKDNNITIDKNMNINGQSRTDTIVSGSGTNWIFYIPTGVNVTISNLSLINGTKGTAKLTDSDVSGGAIYNNGVLNVYNSTFNGNGVIGRENSRGGAIFNIGSLNVTNCIFTNNTVIGVEGSTGGGAIFNSGNMTINYSNFIKNTVGSVESNNPIPIQPTYGGAILNSGGTVTITHSNFEENNLPYFGDRGGAIFNYGFMSILNSSFIRNNAYIGGAIDNDYGTLNVSCSSFTDNIALYEGNGAAINNYGTLNITKSVFTGNQAGDGTIYSNNILNVTSCTFINNKGIGTSCGGAIESVKGSSTVSNSSFTNNSANEGGAIHNGGYYYSSAILNIYNDIFTGNKGHYGGAIENLGTLTVEKSTFTDNTVTRIGGAIYNSGTLTVKSSTFINNNATVDAGAIYNGGTANIHFNRIIGNNARFGKNIFNDGIKTDATLNWWGSNAGPLSTVYNASGTLNVTPWLVLTVSAKPNSITTNNHTTITADLLHDNKGIYHNPANGCVNNGIQLTFTSKYGTLTSPASTVNGCATSTFKCGSNAGTGAIYTKLDNQTIKTLVTIKDPNPLKLSSTTPLNNAQKVSLTSPITIKFTEDIVMGANYSKIYVKNITTGKIVTITKTISGNTLTIKQTSSRLKNDTYLVYIPSVAVKDSTGNNLVTTYTFKFKTG